MLRGGQKEVITLTQKQKIILKHIDGMSNRAIAKELHMSKDTINKYVNEYQHQKTELLLINPGLDQSELIQAIIEKPKYHSNGRKPVKVTQQILDIIEKCLESNRKKRSEGRSKQAMKKIDIHEYLIKQGCSISYSTVKRLVNQDEMRYREAFIRQEYKLGDICEFDWGEVKLDIGGSGFKKYQMAVFTPAKANYRFAILFKSQDTPVFQQPHAEFFEHCGGSYKTMVYDNMKVAVKKFVGLHEKEPTKALTELSIYYGFNFRFCNIAAGNEKGHVERSVEYVRRHAFSAPDHETFDSLAEANQYLFETCMNLNKRRTSNCTIPFEVFEQEKKFLLPHLSKFESCIICESGVDKYSTIVISQNHYSVPDIYVNKLVMSKTYTDKIIIYYGRAVIAVHNRSYVNHDWKIELKHYLRTLSKKPGALHKSTALLQADTKIKNIYDHYYNNDVRTFLHVLEVIYEKGVDAVCDALRELEKISPLDMSADKVSTVCDRRAEKNNIRRDYNDYISQKSRNTLSVYNQLARIQSGCLREEIL